MDKNTMMQNLARVLNEKDVFNGAWLYAEKGEIEAALLAEITSPMIPEEQYAAIVNSGV